MTSTRPWVRAGPTTAARRRGEHVADGARGRACTARCRSTLTEALKTLTQIVAEDGGELGLLGASDGLEERGRAAGVGLQAEVPDDL